MPKMFTMKLAPKWWELTAEGKKTTELRLYDEKRRLIDFNDIIRFCNTDTGGQFLVSVRKVVPAQTFKYIIDDESLEHQHNHRDARFGVSKEEMLKEIKKIYPGRTGRVCAIYFSLFHEWDKDILSNPTTCNTCPPSPDRLSKSEFGTHKF